MKKGMRTILIASMALIISSCSVQQFHVNSTFQDFQNGGRLFGEKMRGKEFTKSGTLFVIGINVLSADVNEMAKKINAEKYTIETRRNLLSFLTKFFTAGIVEYKVVKVIKRDK